MATLTIRNIPDDIHRALRVKAAANGRSMEAEVRGILEVQIKSLKDSERAESLVERLQAVRDRLGPSITDGPSMADELISERRAEAKRS